jgi:hypothetical protein
MGTGGGEVLSHFSVAEKELVGEYRCLSELKVYLPTKIRSGVRLFISSLVLTFESTAQDVYNMLHNTEELRPVHC